MYQPWLSHRVRAARPVPAGGLHAAAVTLAFALMAGLACDEDAPTETRAPSVPAELGATVDEPDLAVGDISTMAIALPVNQSVATTARRLPFGSIRPGVGPTASSRSATPATPNPHSRA